MQSNHQRGIDTKRENRVSGRKEGQAWKKSITCSTEAGTNPDRAKKFSGSGSQAGEDPAQKKRKRQRCKRTDRGNGCKHDVKRSDGCNHLYLAGRTDLRRRTKKCTKKWTER